MLKHSRQVCILFGMPTVRVRNSLSEVGSNKPPELKQIQANQIAITLIIDNHLSMPFCPQIGVNYTDSFH